MRIGCNTFSSSFITPNRSTDFSPLATSGCSIDFN